MFGVMILVLLRFGCLFTGARSDSDRHWNTHRMYLLAPCGPEWAWLEATESCYKAVYNDGTMKSWFDMEKECHQQGAQLASIHSEHENTFVNSLATAADPQIRDEYSYKDFKKFIKIGLRLSYNSNEFVWTDGTHMGHNNFHTLVNDNDFRCGETYSTDSTDEATNKWNAVDCYKVPRAGVCKKKDHRRIYIDDF